MSYLFLHHDAPASRPAGEHAHKVLARTAEAWKLPPASPHAIARRAPHGYVPPRRQRHDRSGLPVARFCW